VPHETRFLSPSLLFTELHELANALKVLEKKREGAAPLWTLKNTMLKMDERKVPGKNTAPSIDSRLMALPSRLLACAMRRWSVIKETICSVTTDSRWAMMPASYIRTPLVSFLEPG